MTNQTISLPRFFRKEIILGDLLKYSSDSRKLYAINGVHLRDQHPQHPLREQVAKNPHKYAAMLIHDDMVDQAHLLANFSHPHIVSVCGLYMTASNVLLIVERMMCTLGECLDQWASKSSPPPLMERLYVVHHISSALTYLHQKNVLFRDLSPDSVGFCMNGHLKLFDFRLAKKINEDERGDSSFSSEYMAPEMVTGKAVGLSADVFSFTMVFWELLMLVPASSDETFEYAKMIQASDWPLWVQDIVVHGVCQEPTERAGMKEIQRCLKRVLKQEKQREQSRNKSLLQ